MTKAEILEWLERLPKVGSSADVFESCTNDAERLGVCHQLMRHAKEDEMSLDDQHIVIWAIGHLSDKLGVGHAERTL